MTLAIVLFLDKRVASAALCIALVSVAIPGALRGALSAHDGPQAPVFERPATVPVALHGYRPWPRVGLSGRHFDAHGVHAAVAAARDTIDVCGSATCLRPPSTSIATLLLAYARTERGPPHHSLS